MAIVFTQEKKKQKYLTILLVLVIFAIILVVWRGFFGKEKEVSPAALPVFAPPEIEINWMALKDPRLQALQVLEEIPSFEEEIGRENPFIPY